MEGGWPASRSAQPAIHEAVRPAAWKPCRSPVEMLVAKLGWATRAVQHSLQHLSYLLWLLCYPWSRHSHVKLAPSIEGINREHEVWRSPGENSTSLNTINHLVIAKEYSRGFFFKTRWCSERLLTDQVLRVVSSFHSWFRRCVNNSSSQVIAWISFGELNLFFLPHSPHPPATLNKTRRETDDRRRGTASISSGPEVDWTTSLSNP